MKKLLLILISIIMIVLICVSINEIKFYYVKKNIVRPRYIEINKIDFVDNRLLFSGCIIHNSFYGDYTEYKYVVKKDKLYIRIYADDVATDIKSNVEFEIIDDKLYNVTEVYLQQGELLRSIATKSANAN